MNSTTALRNEISKYFDEYEIDGYYLDADMTIPFNWGDLTEDLTLYCSVTELLQINITIIIPELSDYTWTRVEGGEYVFDENHLFFYVLNDLDFYLGSYDIELYLEPEFIHIVDPTITSDVTVYAKLIPVEADTVTIHFTELGIPDLVVDVYNNQWVLENYEIRIYLEQYYTSFAYLLFLEPEFYTQADASTFYDGLELYAHFFIYY